MRIDLVQRGKFKRIDTNAIEGIDSLIQFDYMGSSEFEFGALPKSLKRIINDIRNTNFEQYKITINNECFILFSKCLLDNGKEIEDFMQRAYEKKYVNTKETIKINDYFDGEEILQTKRGCINKKEKVTNCFYCNFWWDIVNDWMLVPNVHEYPIKLNIALNKLKEKGFGK